MRDEPLSEIEEAWVQEAERRYQRWKRDKTHAIPADKVLSDLRKEITR